MANDDGDLAGTSSGEKVKRIRELFPVTFDRRDRPSTKDFRPRPVVDSPTIPPVTVMPEETDTNVFEGNTVHPSELPAKE